MTVGDTFGDYKVIRLLGKGGMGEVWLLEGQSGNPVAAKILDAGADHEARKRFLREAQLALGVKHPNLVETYDVGEDPESGLCYILMEYVPGGTLADYIKANGALAIEDAVAVVEAIAGVLELGRQKGIVHRDIKPANIMFDAEGTPKLADLGIARAGNDGTETTTVTQTGVMIGTPAYMSPEQMLDAHNVDTRADIYSLGVVFFEMLTGERPNKDDTIVQLLAKAVKGEPLPDVRTLRPEVSASLAQLLSMMVVPDKEGRISTPGQITNALAIIERGGKFVAHGGEGTRRPTATTGADRVVAPRPPRGHSPWKSLIPVVVVTGIGALFAIGFFLYKPAARVPVRDVGREVTLTNVVKRSVMHTNIVQRNVVLTNAVERNVVLTNSTLAAEVALESPLWKHHVREQKFHMREQPVYAAWLDAYRDEARPVRVCIDLSHGGFPSMTQAFYAKWLKDLPEARQKACWHDLTTENLDSVNVLVLPSSSAQQLYSTEECASINRFLENGGTVVAISEAAEDQLWTMNKFLSQYGLELFQRRGFESPSRDQRKNTHVVRSVCSAFRELQMKLTGLTFAAPSDESGRNSWTPLIVDSRDSAVLMAMRNVGKGHLIWTATWNVTSDLGDYDTAWKRIFLASGQNRQIPAQMPIGQRSATDAPLAKNVGPITVYASRYWRSNAETLARIVRDTLPTLERYCTCSLDPRQMGTTKFVLTGTDIWGCLPCGEKAVVTSATFRGFPDRPVYLATFVFRSMMGNVLPFSYQLQLDNYVALRAFCDMGYPNEMTAAIAEGRNKGDVDGHRYRTDGKTVTDDTGKVIKDGNSAIIRAKFYSAYEDMRKRDADFLVKLVKKRRDHSRKASVADILADLSDVLKTDARPIFAAHGIYLNANDDHSTGSGKGEESVHEALAYDYLWKYKAVEGGVEITACAKDDATFPAAIMPSPSGDLVIPASLGGQRVVSIGRWAFYGCRNLRHLTIPEGVRSIRNRGTFYGCASLESVTFPASLREISASETFSGCRSLKELRFAGDAPRMTDKVGGNAVANLDRLMFRDVPENCVVRVLPQAKGWRGKWPAVFQSGHRVIRRDPNIGTDVKMSKSGVFSWLLHPPRRDRHAQILALGISKHLEGSARTLWESYFTRVDSDVPVRFESNENLSQKQFGDCRLLFLWSRKVTYSDVEIAQLSRYLENGGIVLVFSSGRNGAQAQLLRHFGLGVYKLSSDFSIYPVCPGLLRLPQVWQATAYGVPLEGVTDWHSMVETTGQNRHVVMAFRRVGSGKIFFIAPRTLDSGTTAGKKSTWWWQILNGCGFAIKEPGR